MNFTIIKKDLTEMQLILSKEQDHVALDHSTMSLSVRVRSTVLDGLNISLSNIDILKVRFDEREFDVAKVYNISEDILRENVSINMEVSSV